MSFDAWIQRCRSCPARVIWCRTEKGIAMPVDEKPTPNGNLVLEQLDARDAPIVRRVTNGRPQAVRYQSHFVTCPAAEHHRKPRGSA